MSFINKVFENSIDIVFASDNNYALPTLVAIYSLIDNSSIDNNYDIIVFESDISDENKSKFFDLASKYKNISIRFFNTKKYFEEFDFFHYTYYSADTYSRLFVPEVMKDYDKIVYLDGDIIVLADVAELYNLDLEGNYLAGSINHPLVTSYYHNPDIKKYYDTMYPIDDIRKSVNAGILVMNLEKMREINLLKQGMDLLAKYKRLLYQDEDILNKVCSGKIKHFNSGWNYRVFIPEELIRDYNLLWLAQDWANGLYNQKIIHYTTKFKPWDEPQMYYGEIWWKYAKKSPIYQELLKNYFEKHPEHLK